MVKEPSWVLYQTTLEQDIPVVSFLEKTVPSFTPASIHPTPVPLARLEPWTKFMRKAL